MVSSQPLSMSMSMSKEVGLGLGGCWALLTCEDRILGDQLTVHHLAGDDHLAQQVCTAILVEVLPADEHCSLVLVLFLGVERVLQGGNDLCRQHALLGPIVQQHLH